MWIACLAVVFAVSLHAQPEPWIEHAENLVNMSKHNYHLEPNVSFTPDQKWVVFRSNMFGATYAVAVEVARHG